MAGKKHYRWTIPSAVAAGAVIAATVVIAPWSAQADGNNDADAKWKVVYGSDDLGGQFRSMAVGDAKNVWAFGSRDANEGQSSKTRIAHWNGAKWAEETAPKGSTVDPDFADASGPDNVWAGASSTDGATLVHFDGKKWSNATVKTGDNDTNAVEAVSADDVWVAGLSSDPDAKTSVAKHFDGDSWKDVSGLPYDTEALDSLSAKEVYAAGSDGFQPAVSRWDGKKWTSMKAPKVELTDCESAGFSDVMARSSKDVWAVGTFSCEDENGPDEQSLLYHWDGAKWTTKLGTNPRNFAEVADDGNGGLWLSNGDDTYYHYTDGKLTPFDLGFDQEMQSPTVENLPGTTKMIGTGALYEDGDPPDPQSYGVAVAYGL